MENTPTIHAVVERETEVGRFKKISGNYQKKQTFFIDVS